MDSVRVESGQQELDPSEMDALAEHYDSTYYDKKVLPLYSLKNYSIGVKEPQLEEDPSVTARLARLYEEYHEHGTYGIAIIAWIYADSRNETNS